MSDNQGERPAENTPENTDAPRPADVSAESSPNTPPAVGADAPAADAAPASATPVQTPASAVPPVPPLPQQPTGGWQAPERPTPPAGYRAPQPGQAYARPQGYAGQPAQPQQYASAQPGAAFGPAADPQATLPIAGAPTPPSANEPKKKSGAGKVVGLMVAAAIVGGAAGLGGAYAGVNLFAAQPASSSASGPVTVTVNDTDEVNQTTGIATKVLPSVVTIAATSSGGSGTGSGVIVSEDGYIVTNTHVVTLDGATGAADIQVTTSDGRVYSAEVIGTDPTYDLAVIKIDADESLTPIEVASSSDLNVGDTTVAVGAPLGLSNTVTTGIVSALNRSIEIASSAAPDTGESDSGEGDSEEDSGEGGPFQFDFGQGQSSGTPTQTISIAVIQTDAAINPGNSGGALVDDEGRLIGINVAIATAGGSSDGSGSIGVGFAIPSDIVQRVSDEIIADGAATHGLLGAMVSPAASVEGATITGAYLAEIVDGGAAQAAGLQQGDIVVEFNGVPITDAVDLTAQVRAAAGGTDATVTYVRDGQTQTADVTLGTLE